MRRRESMIGEEDGVVKGFANGDGSCSECQPASLFLRFRPDEGDSRHDAQTLWHTWRKPDLP